MFKQAVVDFQGFQDDNGGMIIKELAVVSLSTPMGSFVGEFQPPYPFNRLSQRMRKTYGYTTRRIHMLEWDGGSLPYSSLRKTLVKLCADMDVVFFKGREKMKIFNNIYGGDGPTTCLIPENYSRVRDITASSTAGVCSIPKHRLDRAAICALRNCFYFACKLNQYYAEANRSATMDRLSYSEDMSTVLAANGFYYVAGSGNLVCAWCFKYYDCLQKRAENVLDEHRRGSDDCPSFGKLLPNVPAVAGLCVNYSIERESEKAEIKC